MKELILQRLIYPMLDIDEDSKKLLTISSHNRFPYKRLTFDVKSVPALFQQVMDAMLTGLTGTAAFIDDIIIARETLDELLNCLFSSLNGFSNMVFISKQRNVSFSRCQSSIWILYI